MAIIPVTKVTLYGTADQKDAVLDKLQDLGYMHLVNLRGSSEAAGPLPNISAETYQALKFLRTCPTRRRSLQDDTGFQFDAVVQEALRIEQRQQQLQEEHDELDLAIGNLTPWGDFHLPRDGELGDVRLWFYVVPHYRLRTLENRDLTWNVVSRDHRFAYVVVISATERQDMLVARKRLD